MARLLATFIAACIGGAGLCGCAGRGKDAGEANAPAASPAADRPVIIGHLVTKDRTITIFSGGPRFTVETLDGLPIAENVSLEGLEAVDPSAASAFRTGIAERSGVLDASLWTAGDRGPEPARRRPVRE